METLIIGKVSTYPPKEFGGELSYSVLPQGKKDWVDLHGTHGIAPRVGDHYTVEYKSNVGKNGRTYWHGYVQQQTQAGNGYQAPAPAPQRHIEQTPVPSQYAPVPPPTQQQAPAPTPSPSPAPSTKLSFMDYCMLVNSVHVLALSIEPDFYKESEGGYAPHHVDRSQARIALINTAVIAATKGLLEIPAAILEPGDLHNPDGQDAPF